MIDDDHILFMGKQSMADRDLYSGLIRLHILHHAVEEPIFGQNCPRAKRGTLSAPPRAKPVFIKSRLLGIG